MDRLNPHNTPGFHPFGELIGLTFTRVEPGFSQCRLRVEDRLLNPHHSLHGGVMYSMADTGMGGALYPLLETGETCYTVEIKIAYFRAVRSGDLVCDSRVVHKGRTVAAIESEVRLDDDTLVAKALGTFSVVSKDKNGR